MPRRELPDAVSDCHPYADAYAYAYADRVTDPDCHSRSYGQCYGESDRYTASDCQPNADVLVIG